jgi:p-aminobenzoyl-glutamate transporter AbgT
MNNFDAYVTNIVYGLFLLVGYNFCGIIPTILGFLTWFVIDKILEPKFEEEKKAEIVALVAGVLVAVISSLILKKVLFGQ